MSLLGSRDQPESTTATAALIEGSREGTTPRGYPRPHTDAPRPDGIVGYLAAKKLSSVYRRWNQSWVVT
jgi:hypothetical protein